jgi:glycosyltransferase involved in cell wall biosynthesis
MIASGYPSESKPVRDIFIHEQAREMARQGLGVHIITSGSAGDPGEEIMEEVHVHRVMDGNFRPARLFPFVFATKAAVKAGQLNRVEKFDLVHSHFADHAGLAGAIISRIMRIPFVLTVHGYDVNCSKELSYGIGTTWLGRMYVYLILRSATIVCPVSTALKKQCITKWCVNPEKLVVVPNGIHLLEMPEEEELNKFRSALNVADKRIILSVSSLVKLKGQQNVIKALPSVIKEVPNAILVIVGEGPYLAQLKQSIKQLGLENHVKTTNRFAKR